MGFKCSVALEQVHRSAEINREAGLPRRTRSRTSIDESIIPSQLPFNLVSTTIWLSILFEQIQWQRLPGSNPKTTQREVGIELPGFDHIEVPVRSWIRLSQLVGMYRPCVGHSSEPAGFVTKQHQKTAMATWLSGPP